MTECFILIEEDYKKVYERWVTFTGNEVDEDEDEEELVCEDVEFEDYDDWCLATLLCDDSFAEEVLLELSGGNKLLYFYIDEDMLDCEFLVMDNNTILRKKYVYYDTPELNEDEGQVKCEEEHAFNEWHDIGYFMDLARETPEVFFE